MDMVKSNVLAVDNHITYIIVGSSLDILARTDEKHRLGIIQVTKLVD